MYRRRLSEITVSADLFQIKPLQDYICSIAGIVHVAENKAMRLRILVDEVFSHIVGNCFAGRTDGTVTITVDATPASMELSFRYQGLPFAYSPDKPKDEIDEISLTMIRALSTSYRMKEDGKRGQAIELSIAVNPDLELTTQHETPHEPEDDSQLVMREVRPDEMEKMVQCLYKVFGYSYSAEAIYYPDVLRERIASGLYKGLVAVDSHENIVAHVAMLKSAADDEICECGQAFVSPEYHHRGLFVRLKQLMIDEAGRMGLRGVYSSAVTGHPYTQMANLRLGCVETGLELSYIPSDLKSVIGRKGEEQRQAVMSYIRLTAHQEPQAIYVPLQHKDIIADTYRHLGLERTLLPPPRRDGDGEPGGLPATGDCDSVIETVAKTEWNQLHLTIQRAGHNLATRVEHSLRRALSSGTAVAYVSLAMTDPTTPAIVDTLERVGFFYSGIMPYEKGGGDAIRLQYVADTALDETCVIAQSDWGKQLKQYVFEQMRLRND